MQVTWIIQTNMGKQSDIMGYVNAVKESGAKVIEVAYIPFSGLLPQFEIENGPVVFYGDTGFIKTINESGKFQMGVFGDIDTFTYDNWAKHYNEMLLNSPDNVELLKLGDFSMEGRNQEDLIFVRPQLDTKSIAGTVMTVKEFYDWTQEAKTGLYANLNYDTAFIVAKPYGIKEEWRLFVVDGKVVASSQYYKNGRLFKQEGAPEFVLDFAKKAIERWNPVPAYILDIGTSAGNCYIIEAQGFNCAGAYHANIKDVATAVNQVAADIWMKLQQK